MSTHMNANTIKNAVEAHGWVGIFVAIPLFIIFWAGAITLFHPEISTWSVLALRPENTAHNSSTIDLAKVIEDKVNTIDRDPAKTVFVGLPDDHSPFLNLYVPLSKPVHGEDYTEIAVDPHTGEILATGHLFEYSNFLYELHYSLKLPQGLYIVGLITLFFLVLLMTGLVIQLKLLFKHFFLYRHNKGPRMRSYDLHSITGVITLPFTFLYSLTGLMFNLNILLYLPILFLLYGGNRADMFKAAGFPQVSPERTEVVQALPPLEPLITQVERKHQAHVSGLSFINFGDENMVIRLRGITHTFGKNLDVYYDVKSKTFPSEYNPESQVFSAAVMPLYMLHMGQFGGPGVRFIFFILALGVCGMIVAGNILWLIKRQNRMVEFPRSTKIIRGLTIGACAGVVLATCFGFLLERVIPPTLDTRAEMVQWSFWIAFVVTTIAGFYIQHINLFLARCAWISAGLLGILLVYDTIFYGQFMIILWQEGEPITAMVTIGFALITVMLAWLGQTLNRGWTNKASNTTHSTAGNLASST